MLLHCCCKQKAKTPQSIDLQCLLLLILVPRAGVEPARVLPHWCLRPTRLPIPPSGRIAGAKVNVFFEIGTKNRRFFAIRAILGVLYR